MRAIIRKLIVIVIVFVAMACSKERPASKAVKLVKESYALEKSQTTELIIENSMKEIEKKGDDVKRIGWVVKKKGEQIYLVSYEYEVYSYRRTVARNRGYFFEVNIVSGVVRNVTANYEWLHFSTPFQDEKDIQQRILQEQPIGRDREVDTALPATP